MSEVRVLPGAPLSRCIQALYDLAAVPGRPELLPTADILPTRRSVTGAYGRTRGGTLAFRHDRRKEHGAFANPAGRPQRIGFVRPEPPRDGTQVPEPLCTRVLGLDMPAPCPHRSHGIGAICAATTPSRDPTRSRHKRTTVRSRSRGDSGPAWSPDKRVQWTPDALRRSQRQRAPLMRATPGRVPFKYGQWPFKGGGCHAQGTFDTTQ